MVFNRQSNTIVGIDFGTTTSAISVVQNGYPSLIHVDGDVLLPSIVAFDDNGNVMVGAIAKRQAVVNPERTFRSIKRQVGEEKRYMIGDVEWSAEQIGAQILLRLKKGAEKQLGRPLGHAVITVPAYFNQLQRQSVREIGRMAGFNVLRIINEPTAAVLAYAINETEEQNVLVFDFGGGTFDVSMLTIARGVFEVKATGGSNRLGGDDIDRLIVKKIVNDFIAVHLIDLTKDKMAMQKLRDAAEKVKIELSDKDAAQVRIPFITADEHGPKHIDTRFSVEMLEELTKPLINRLINLARETLRAAGIDKTEINHILLAGGSTRIPAVRKAIVQNFGDKLLGGVNPVECVALGASVQAAIIAGMIKDAVLVDITPFSLGVEIEDGGTEMIIPRNSTIPMHRKKVFTTVVDNQTEVEINVLQGNSNRAAENMALGRFILGGLKKERKGVPKVEVTFDIDVNGIMRVSAMDYKTGAIRNVNILRPTAGKRPEPRPHLQ